MISSSYVRGVISEWNIRLKVVTSIVANLANMKSTEIASVSVSKISLDAQSVHRSASSSSRERELSIIPDWIKSLSSYARACPLDSRLAASTSVPEEFSSRIQPEGWENMSRRDRSSSRVDFCPRTLEVRGHKYWS